MVEERNWEKVQLGDILSVRHGKSQHQVVNSNGVYPIFGTGGLMGWADEFLYDKPSVLIGRKGTINRPQYFDKPFWTIDTLFYTEINKNVSAKYIYYLFNTIDWYSHNEASGVPSLNSKVIEKISILLPSLEEQKVIAKALTDTDNLIHSMEKLIDKKEKIKKGTMQELLTGKKRLDGFSGEWGNKSLYELVEFINGKAHENFISDIGKYIVVNSRFVSTEGNVIKYSNQGNCLALTNDILMVMSDVPNGRAIAKCYYVEEDNRYTINQRVCILRSKDIISKFLFYVVDRNSHYLSFDDGVKQTNLKRDDVLNLNIKVPPLNEQKAISQAISDMDQEIQVLTRKLEKYKTIKQGMMQELLTGRIRLI